MGNELGMDNLTLACYLRKYNLVSLDVHIAKMRARSFWTGYCHSVLVNSPEGL